MGYRHTKQEILDGALRVAFDDGLSQLTYGRVARQLGISDRVVVYYFPSKDDLVGEVLVGVGIQLQQALEPAFRAPARDHLQLVRAAWPIMAREEADAVFSLFLEATGLAASGRAPYCDLVPQLVEAWIAWAADYLQGTPLQRRAEAETAIALLDGLLLLRKMAGSAAAERAAKRIGASSES